MLAPPAASAAGILWTRSMSGERLVMAMGNGDFGRLGNGTARRDDVSWERHHTLRHVAHAYTQGQPYCCSRQPLMSGVLSRHSPTHPFLLQMLPLPSPRARYCPRALLCPPISRTRPVPPPPTGASTPPPE